MRKWLVVLVVLALAVVGTAFAGTPSTLSELKSNTRQVENGDPDLPVLSGDPDWPSFEKQMVDEIGGHELVRPVDARWVKLFQMLRGDDRYDAMTPSEVFAAAFGEDEDVDYMHVPDRRDGECNVITWGELKRCFGDGSTPGGEPGGDTPTNPDDGDDPPEDPPDEG